MLAAVLCGAAACPLPGALAQVPEEPAGTGGLLADHAALVGRPTAVPGTLAELAGGGAVRIERLAAGGRWVSEASATASAGGAFVARWRPRAAGRFLVRAVAEGAAIRAASAPPTAHLTVYRPARATWYGPGLYGRRTACGQRLTRTLLGVAHRRLPCGTPVELYLDGRSVTVPVVDRGPFAHGAHYDLTRAAARQIGMTETTTIGVVPLRGARVAPPPPAPWSATGGVSAGSAG
jgi:rare lipoprotein A